MEKNIEMEKNPLPKLITLYLESADFKERLQGELMELLVRKVKLEKYINSGNEKDEHYLALCKIQLRIISSYIKILCKRMKLQNIDVSDCYFKVFCF